MAYYFNDHVFISAIIKYLCNDQLIGCVCVGGGGTQITMLKFKKKIKSKNNLKLKDLLYYCFEH